MNKLTGVSSDKNKSYVSGFKAICSTTVPVAFQILCHSTWIV